MKEQILKDTNTYESVPSTSSNNSGSTADTGSSPGSRSYDAHMYGVGVLMILAIACSVFIYTRNTTGQQQDQ